ncbi:MAG: hypothetical protein V1723_04595 [Candidatus Uhrbacteria bacterium]
MARGKRKRYRVTLRQRRGRRFKIARLRVLYRETSSEAKQKLIIEKILKVSPGYPVESLKAPEVKAE